MSAETAVNSSIINTFNLLRPWDSKVEKLTLPGSANSLLTPASLPGLLSPMLMPHLTSLTQGTSSASTASTSALLSQVPLLSPAISIPAAVTSHQQHQALSQRPTTSQTSLSLLPPPTLAGISSSTCSNLTRLSQSEDKESKREHRRRDHLSKCTTRTSTLFDNLLSSYQEQQISRNRNSMQNLFPFNFAGYQTLLQNSKHAFRSPMEVVLRCSTPNCSCDCFVPSKPLMRVCAHCNHGWIAHAMEKLNLDKLFNTTKYGSPTLAGQNIPGFPTGNTLFDIASLMLFGTHALPVRLKILLDRLLCTLEHEELVNLLHAFGWTYEDYSRGYMLQDSVGNILTKWIIVSKEEEIYIIQLFLKFPETKTIAQNFVLTESIFSQYSDTSAIFANKFKDYELKKLVDCTNANLLQKNSLLNLNSLKSPVSESLNTHNARNHFENKASKTSNHCDTARESEDRPNRSLKSNAEETSTNKQSNKVQLSPVNHLVSTSPKSEKSKDKCAANNQNALNTPFNTLSKLENLMPPFEYRKKEAKNSLITEANPDPSQFLAATVSASATSLTNPLFSLASPLSNFNSLLNPALLVDPSKYQNAADLCKIDLTNPAAAVAAAAALNKNLDFSSFKTDSACNSNASSNNCPPTSDAINLTQNSKHANSNHNDKKANKHLRKSSNPIKRRWDPLILSNLNTNPSTGKKRVQCNVCLKTFCDKGALKIHFSAVHLREMHKCSVDGCNMMFSSRRSRNRHSANPNPKLHTPNFRRKINPHDGRTANPYPHLSAPSGALFGIGAVNGGLMSNFDNLKGNYSDHSAKGDYALDFNSMSSHSSRGTPNEELMDDTYSDDNSCKDMDEENDDDGDDDICIDLSVKDDTHKSPRKRKNFNPIKFSSNGNCNNEMDNEHDNDNGVPYQYLSTDDDDDDDLSSDVEYSSKRMRHESDGIESELGIDKQIHTDNDADTDVDIDEVENGKLNHLDEKDHTHNNLVDSGDEHEVGLNVNCVN